ncbi:hypothetical protein [Nocardia abscessus]|uniref:hypothetical protein n=1 Tax=Nocardia abscessus TaxID=120957 RepID=UPI00245471AE|nr:hypothetical protein [Nocardia abscessus]
MTITFNAISSSHHGRADTTSSQRTVTMIPQENDALDSAHVGNAAEPRRRP